MREIGMISRFKRQVWLTWRVLISPETFFTDSQTNHDE